MKNYENQTFDQLFSDKWHNKSLQQARAQMLGMGPGMVDKDSASLMGVQLGKEHKSQFASEAADRMASDEAIMRAKMLVKQFYDELIMQEAALPATELQIIHQAAAQEYAQYQALQSENQANVTDGPLIAGVGLTIAARALNGLKTRFDAYADKHNLSPKARKLAYALMIAPFIVACGAAPFIQEIIETSQPPLETFVAPVGTLVELDAGEAGAQEPSVTPSATKEKTPTPKPKATATEAATEEVPAFLSTYLEEYKDQVYVDGSIYGVLDQSKTLYPKEDKGVMYKGSTFFGFTKVYFTDPDTKLLTEGYVTEGICTPVKGTNYCYFTGSASIFTSDGSKPTLAFFKGITEQMRSTNTGDQPVVKLDFSSTIPGLDEVFNNVFGKPDGKLKWIEIPGVGKVLNVRQYSEVQE